MEAYLRNGNNAFNNRCPSYTTKYDRNLLGILSCVTFIPLRIPIILAQMLLVDFVKVC